MKLAIIGSRSFSDYKLLKDHVINNFPDVRIIISGGAKGADQLGEKLAKELCLSTEIYFPEWKKYGRSAAPIRNEIIVKNSDAIIAFWDGASPGTKNSIKICRRIKKKLVVFTY